MEGKTPDIRWTDLGLAEKETYGHLEKSHLVAAGGSGACRERGLTRWPGVKPAFFKVPLLCRSKF
jgi:hypothetical protein